jgi:flagellar protein FlbD
MIKVTDVTRRGKYINCDLIERIEQVPDTLVTLVNGHSSMVLETPEEIVDRIIQFKRRCGMPPELSDVLPEESTNSSKS